MAHQAPSTRPRETRIRLGDVPVGYAFSPLPVAFPKARVRAYRDVLEMTAVAATGEDLVPPATAATLALGALLQHVVLPLGTLHAAQEIEAHSPLPVGSTVTCRATVTGRTPRGGAIFLTLDFSLVSSTGQSFLDGKATLLMPSPAGG